MVFKHDLHLLSWVWEGNILSTVECQPLLCVSFSLASPASSRTLPHHAPLINTCLFSRHLSLSPTNIINISSQIKQTTDNNESL